MLCLLAGCVSLLLSLLPRWLPSSQYSLIRDQSTRTTLLSNAADDWQYRHPEPEPEPGADSQHYLVNNPYIQWHVENGTFYLLPDALREELRRDGDVVYGGGT